MRAMEQAYMVSFFGPEIMPMPKVSILHKDLKRIAVSVDLESQTQYAEFLDDLCLCGLKNHREALRKMESRDARFAKLGASKHK